MGGKDPGVYMNEGIQIAQRGTLTIVDDVVRTVPPDTAISSFPKAGRRGTTATASWASSCSTLPRAVSWVSSRTSTRCGLRWVRTRWLERSAPGRRRSRGARPARHLLLWRAHRRTGGRNCRRSTTGDQRAASLVRALSKCRDRDATARIRRPSRLYASAVRRRSLLRAARRAAVRAGYVHPSDGRHRGRRRDGGDTGGPLRRPAPSRRICGARRRWERGRACLFRAGTDAVLRLSRRARREPTLASAGLCSSGWFCSPQPCRCGA